jgi:hypothetical protein
MLKGKSWCPSRSPDGRVSIWQVIEHNAHDTSPLVSDDNALILQESGIAATSRLTPPTDALRRFTFVRDHHAPTASFRPALTEAHSAKPQHQQTARSLPGRALASSMLGSPCQGPRTELPFPISTTCPARAAAYGLDSAAPARTSARWSTFQPALRSTLRLALTRSGPFGGIGACSAGEMVCRT